jgi:hypothetical protein
MNVHWESFCSHRPWFVLGRWAEAAAARAPGAWRPASPDFEFSFPTLAYLLRLAHLSDVVINGHPYVLFSWPNDGDYRCWLAELPCPESRWALYPAHRILLESFGGIVERSNEPLSSWLLNNYAALTDAEAARDATFINHYAWAFEDVPGGIPIDLEAYYSIAREANGNHTLCHRVQGDVLLFAPDHNFSHIRPLEGCPEYTLYRILEAPTFSSWVEIVASQWLASVVAA